LQLGALTLLGALAIGLGFSLWHRPAAGRIDLAGKPLVVRQGLEPRDPQFGDTVVATIDVLADRSRVDAESIKLGMGFRAHTVVSTTRSVRTIGGVSVIHVETRLRCLDQPCVPAGKDLKFEFDPARVAYRDGSRTRMIVSRWPALRIHSRLTKADLARPALRVPPPIVESVRYRLPPPATAYALLVLGGLLAAAGFGVLLAVGLRGAAPKRRRVAPLERVLSEVAASCSNGDSGRRRRALEELARQLEPLDAPLSEESRVLAWGPAEPHGEAISDLASRVRTAVRA